MLNVPETPIRTAVPPGCWVDQDDWTEWPRSDYVCNPSEWPYNLEAPKGTREFSRIIDWFLRNHPQVYGPDLGTCLALIEECAPDKTITARVSLDPELGTFTLCLRVYECAMSGRMRSKELDLYWQREEEHPHLKELHCHVSIWHAGRGFPGHDRLI